MTIPATSTTARPERLPSIAVTLPEDGTAGTLVGRIWRPDVAGPSVVVVRGEDVVDVTGSFPTMRDLCEQPSPADAVREADGDVVGSLADVLANSLPDSRDASRPWVISPVDLQAVKAAGVTFVSSMLERVIEERAKGEARDALRFRAEITELLGEDLATLRPGSPEADKLKDFLVSRDSWSQYLEVGIGPDAEIFTKAQPLSTVGTGADVGVHPKSHWNNPEPEVVLVVSSTGAIVGATLGNDVNLRDFEGRSALLLSKAKDNNASAAVGPFIRLFDSTFSLDDVRTTTVTMRVEGEDGFVLTAEAPIRSISRDPADLVAQLIGSTHQYPDGAVLYLGTPFAPVEDRDSPGEGFTHKPGDVVTIAAPQLGALVNRVQTSDQCEPWEFGAGSLMRNLVSRHLL